MKKNLLLLSLLMVQIVSSQIIDTTNSKVTFKVNNMNVRTVKGEFTKMTGTIAFNDSDLSESYFNVCVNAESLKTDTERRDKNLKHKNFFNTKKYPEICFQSDSIMRIFGAYIVEGKLTLRGITKSVRIPLSYKKNTLSGNFEINRNDFKLGNGISSFMIDNSVNVTIICKLKNEGLALNEHKQIKL